MEPSIMSDYAAACFQSVRQRATKAAGYRQLSVLLLEPGDNAAAGNLPG